MPIDPTQLGDLMLIHLRRIAASGGKASKGKTSEAKRVAARINWKKAAAAMRAKREKQKQERDHDDDRTA